LAAVALVGVDRSTDHHLDGAGEFDKAFRWPAMTGVMRHRNYRHTGLARQRGAAAGVIAGLADRRACALGKYHYRATDAEPTVPLFHDVLQRLFGVIAVDRDRLEQGETPAEERHTQ